MKKNSKPENNTHDATRSTTFEPKALRGATDRMLLMHLSDDAKNMAMVMLNDPTRSSSVTVCTRRWNSAAPTPFRRDFAAFDLQDAGLATADGSQGATVVKLTPEGARFALRLAVAAKAANAA